jgi:hypothetical protein
MVMSSIEIQSLREFNTPFALIQIPQNPASMEEMEERHADSIGNPSGATKYIDLDDWPNQLSRSRPNQLSVQSATFGHRKLSIGAQPRVGLVGLKLSGLLELVVQRRVDGEADFPSCVEQPGIDEHLEGLTGQAHVDPVLAAGGCTPTYLGHC